VGNRLSKIYTKTGDDRSILVAGHRASCASPACPAKNAVFAGQAQPPEGGCARASMPAMSCLRE